MEFGQRVCSFRGITQTKRRDEVPRVPQPDCAVASLYCQHCGFVVIEVGLCVLGMMGDILHTIAGLFLGIGPSCNVLPCIAWGWKKRVAHHGP